MQIAMSSRLRNLPLYCLLLLGLVSLQACLTPGTQTAAPTGTAAEVSGYPNSGGSTEVTEETFAENLPGAGGSFGTGGPNGMQPAPSSQGSSSQSSAGGASGNKWGPILARQGGGLPSGQVAPVYEGGVQFNFTLKGTWEPVCRVEGVTWVHVQGSVDIGSQDGLVKKMTSLPSQVMFRICYKAPQSGGEMSCADRNFQLTRGSSSVYDIDETVVTVEPGSLRLYVIDASGHQIIDEIHRDTETARRASFIVPPCPTINTLPAAASASPDEAIERR